MSASAALRRVLLVLSTGLVLALVTACSKQGEGERCDSQAAGDSDCEDGLVCRSADVQRCCPPPGAPVSDSRCNRTPPTGTGGTGGRGGSGGSAGSAGAAVAGNGGTVGEPSAGTGGVPDETTGGTSGDEGGAAGTTSSGGAD